MITYFRSGVSRIVLICAAMATAEPATAQSAPSSTPAATATDLQDGDIVVTARRREESAQSVPVSVTAFSGETLRTAGVKSLNDLTAITPGLRYSSEGEGNTTSVTLRGLAVTPTGETLPAVVTYFSEVALPSKGVNIPTFDLENIQVLKGPQGTLFGRNTIGGAVLLTPRKPDYSINGYAEASYGNLDYWRLAGAVNVPLIDDILAIRIAGEIKRRDGYVKDVSGGHALSDIHNQSLRGSIRFEPTPDISNILIVEYFNAPENASGNVTTGISPGIATIEQFFDAPTGGTYAQQIRDLVAQQKALGPFKVDYGIDGYSKRHGIAVVNTTVINLSDDISFKNIFGYRRLKTDILGNFGALNPFKLNGPLGNLSVLTQNVKLARQLMSDEAQLQGKLFDGKLDWIVGGIYSEDKPYGASNGSSAQIFAPFYPQPATYVSTIFGSSSKALFAQGSLDIGDWTVRGLKVTGGFRYTWDDVSACSLGLSEASGSDLLGFDHAGYVSDKACRSVAALDNPIDGAGIVKVSGNEPTYTLGVDWQATDKVLLYFAHRHGFRGVNVNSPKFETPFTTGGTGCLSSTGVCPDLRPFQITSPEKLDDFELGLKTEWQVSGIRGRFNIALYQNKITNQVQFVQVATLGIPSNAVDNPQSGALGLNAAAVRNRGVEIEGRTSFTRSFSISYNGAYNHADILSVSLPPGLGGLSLTKKDINRPTPKFSGSVAADWEPSVEIAGGTLALHGDVFHTTGWYPQAGQSMPGYTLANARIDLKGLGGAGVDFGLWGRNIFNNKYETAPVILVPGFPVRTVVFGEPRTYGIDVRYRF